MKVSMLFLILMGCAHGAVKPKFNKNEIVQFNTISETLKFYGCRNTGKIVGTQLGTIKHPGCHFKYLIKTVCTNSPGKVAIVHACEDVLEYPEK